MVRNRRRARTQYHPQRRYYLCGKQGHEAKDCTNPNPQCNKNFQFMPVRPNVQQELGNALAARFSVSIPSCPSGLLILFSMTETI